MNETAIKNQIKNFLDSLDLCENWAPVTSGMATGRSGQSDRIVVYKGLVIFLEIKRSEDSKLSDRQRKFARDVLNAGGNFFCCSSVDELKILLDIWDKQPFNYKYKIQDICANSVVAYSEKIPTEYRVRDKLEEYIK